MIHCTATCNTHQVWAVRDPENSQPSQIPRAGINQQEDVKTISIQVSKMIITYSTNHTK